MGYGGGGINGALRWRDLALDELLPIDEEREDARRAAQARKLASGTSNHNPQPQQHQQPPQMAPDPTMDDSDDDSEDENNENDNEDEDEEEDSEVGDD